MTILDGLTLSRLTGTLIPEVVSGYSAPLWVWGVTVNNVAPYNQSGSITDDNVVIGNRTYLASELTNP